MRKKMFFTMVLLMLVLVSCAPGADSRDAMMDPEPTEVMMEEQMDGKATATGVPVTGGDVMMEKTNTPEMMDEPHDPMMATSSPEAGMMDEKDAMMSAPAWIGAELTDEGTGDTFRIEDFKGKVVLVETFAQWCPTCLSQQQEFVRLHEILGMPDDLVTVSLDVDPNEDAAMLRKYLEKHEFDWRFAIAPPETVREIGSLYGQQFLNPPSAPVMIIDRKGEAHVLPFGVKSAEDLQEALKPYLDGGM